MLQHEQLLLTRYFTEQLFDTIKPEHFKALTELIPKTPGLGISLVPTFWRPYPGDKLQGKYMGHQVRFFTIPVEDSARAKPFFDTLKQNGFEVELKQAGEKPSIVVDLTMFRI